jgi:hypothetical protein
MKREPPQSHSQEADIKLLAKLQQTMKRRRVAEEQHLIRLCVIPRLLVVMSFLGEASCKDLFL